MIRRRFIQVPERTLRYDLKKLLDRKLIEKSGETRGRYYRATRQI
jgi:DNA-binding transcriptional ArsR family regulator